MKISSVEFCGFRGFLRPFTIPFGQGFTVICGRNGVGKSTIFDAIEFALTGEIDKYRIEKAAKESLQDYIWWRGSGQAERYFVRVTFESRDGTQFAVTRTREGGADKSASEIELHLCTADRPDRPLKQLCRTSIIRDELIAALSLDLSESERFDLVRSALGAIEGPEYAAKAREVLTTAEASAESTRKNHESERIQLNSALTHLSELRSRASKTGDIAAAMSTLTNEIGSQHLDLSQKLFASRELIAKRRLRISELTEVLRNVYALAAMKAELETETNRQHRREVVQRVEQASERVSRDQAVVSKAKEAVAREQTADNLAAALLSVAQHGEQIGLHDGHCPLCSANRSSSEFAAGISLAKARAKDLAAGLVVADQELKRAQAEAEADERDLQQAQAALHVIAAKEEAASSLARTCRSSLEKARIDPALVDDPGRLDGTIHQERERVVALEQAVLVLESSQAVELVTAAEMRVADSRTRAADAELALSRAQSAVTSAKLIAHAVSRTSAEIVDEQLALINPLLGELYSRLRPHADWKSIEYSIRGDVRRFLSLRVGDGLNPQFIFSSGQRRAAGLAFLLSVHLSRAWSVWQTLLLDDPVQHIDDFRALHLVEVLAALRNGGRQIVCAVEDVQLADLLCRRLVSTSDEPGVRCDLAQNPAGGVSATRITEIAPLSPGALRSSELRAM